MAEGDGVDGVEAQVDCENRVPSESGEPREIFTINGKRVVNHDLAPTGRDLLERGGFAPASEHILVQLMRPGSRLVGLDDEVERAHFSFRAFASDRVFSFTVEEVAYVWGDGTISEPELREIARVADDEVLFLERENEHDELLGPDTVIDLSENGTEHFHCGKRFITIFYRETPFELKRGIYSGAQLSTIFQVPAGYLLDLVEPNDFKEIGASDRLKIREGMHFVAHPPKGQSS